MGGTAVTIWRALRNERHPIPLTVMLPMYLGYAVVLVVGLLEEAVSFLFSNAPRGNRGDYFDYTANFTDFFRRHIYMRLRDCFERPLRGPAGRLITIGEREFRDNGQQVVMTRGVREAVVNMASYNYFGFQSDEINEVTADMQRCLDRYRPGRCQSVAEGGRVPMHGQLEELVATFLGREAALIFGMGYATNSSALSALASALPGTLVLSDELNHTSIIAGIRQSRAECRKFRHNDVGDLRRRLLQALAADSPPARVLVVVEGLYSMEGDFCPLVEIVRLKREFIEEHGLPVFLYLDEAHSIGALGRTGRGLTELLGVNVQDVDVMMGTFSKSFASTGGYVCGDRAIIDWLRVNADGQYSLSAMSPLCCQQVITCLRAITGDEQRRIDRLQYNVQYFRERLRHIGFQVLGDPRSPVVPIMLYMLSRMSEFSRFCLANRVAVVVVGHPATSLGGMRARICLSAAHTREDLDMVLEVFERAGRRVCVLK